MAKKPIFDNQNINLPEGKQYKIYDEAIIEKLFLIKKDTELLSN